MIDMSSSTNVETFIRFVMVFLVIILIMYIIFSIILFVNVAIVVIH